MKPTTGLVPPGYRLCPCEENCGEWSKTLTGRGHARGCTCRSCTSSRNVRKGKRAHAQMYKRMGGTGFTPGHEESSRILEIRVLPESKGGYAKATVKFWQFLATEFFQRALSQSVRAIPAGSGALPAVCLRGRWLIVDLAAGDPRSRILGFPPKDRP